jgi:hypothetical protein
MEENRIPNRVLYMNWGTTSLRWQADQEIDGNMGWERMEE